MKKIIIATIIFLSIISYSAIAEELNKLPPYNKPITIEHCDKLFSQIKGYNYFMDMNSENHQIGEYSYCFSIGWPKLPHLVQAAILESREILFLTWWSSERRDTRIIIAALLFTLERVTLDTFHPPNPMRFNKKEKIYRIEENKFVIENLEYFYKQFLPIFKKTLGEGHDLVKMLKSKSNLKPFNIDYLKNIIKP